jgi:hypothetical protein
METKHTPGPWQASENGFLRMGVRDASGAWMTYKAGEDYMGPKQLEANAKLIAAAPDLLEALECLKREVILSDVDMAYIDTHFKPWIEKARAAIAKATE